MTFNKLGIIPAAGKASRFGGILKECLPISDNGSFLRRTIYQMEECDMIVVVSSVDRIEEHARHLGEMDNVILRVQYHHYREMLGAWEIGMEIPAERYYMAMPDTYHSGFKDPGGDFAIGVFETDQNGRFGIFQKDGNVEDKAEAGLAWGNLIWSKKVRDMWRETHITNYTRAINTALVQLDPNDVFKYKLDYYYDIASFNDYIVCLLEGVL